MQQVTTNKDQPLFLFSLPVVTVNLFSELSSLQEGKTGGSQVIRLCVPHKRQWTQKATKESDCQNQSSPKLTEDASRVSLQQERFIISCKGSMSQEEEEEEGLLFLPHFSFP